MGGRKQQRGEWVLVPTDRVNPAPTPRCPTSPPLPIDPRYFIVFTPRIMKLGSFILLLSVLAFFAAASLHGAEAGKIEGTSIRRVKEDDDEATEDVATTSAEAEEEEGQNKDAELQAAMKAKIQRSRKRRRRRRKRCFISKRPTWHSLPRKSSTTCLSTRQTQGWQPRRCGRGVQSLSGPRNWGSATGATACVLRRHFGALPASAPHDGARQPTFPHKQNESRRPRRQNRGHCLRRAER